MKNIPKIPQKISEKSGYFFAEILAKYYQGSAEKYTWWQKILRVAKKYPGSAKKYPDLAKNYPDSAKKYPDAAKNDPDWQK